MNTSHRTTILLTVAICLLATGIIVMKFSNSDTSSPEMSPLSAPAVPGSDRSRPISVEECQNCIDKNEKVPKNSTIAEQAELPQLVHHRVPFTSQAPYGNWDQPYQDACEETSLIMWHAAREKITLDPATADAKIHELVDLQNITGSFHDTTAEETAQLAHDAYGYEIPQVAYDMSIEEMKRALSENNLLITPAAGQLLGNPNFTPPGPEYHMLVVIGYDDTTQEFITNDPGTRNGQDFRYAYETLHSAIHDWTGDKATIQKGRNAVIIAPLLP